MRADTAPTHTTVHIHQPILPGAIIFSKELTGARTTLECAARPEGREAHWASKKSSNSGVPQPKLRSGDQHMTCRVTAHDITLLFGLQTLKCLLPLLSPRRLRGRRPFPPGAQAPTSFFLSQWIKPWSASPLFVISVAPCSILWPTQA